MRILAPAILVATMLMASQETLSPRPPRTLALVVAHADDEGPVAPILARPVDVAGFGGQCPVRRAARSVHPSRPATRLTRQE